MQRLGPRAYLVLEKKIFKGFYHTWAWQPYWSMDHAHFSNLSLSCPRRLCMKFEQHWPRRFRGKIILKLSKFFPYKCTGPIQMHTEANLTSPKSQMSMYDNYFSNFGRPPIPNDICKDSAIRHPRFWRIRFLNVLFPYKCIGKQTWPCHKKVKCQCKTIILATLVDPMSLMI